MKEKIIGLDVLRAFAILLVLLWHWVPENHSFNYFFNGKLGVNLFFVLSGYLISKSLLVDSHSRIIDQLKQFYYRRFFRIFPIYYLVLTLLISIDYFNIREMQGWYWMYGVNVLHEINNEVVPYTIHFWSLSVEEQFYLVWPILFLVFVKLKRKPMCFLIGLFLFSLIFQLCDSLIVKIPWFNLFIYFSSFALGSFLIFVEGKIKKCNVLLILSFAVIIVILVSFGVRNGYFPTYLNNFCLDLSYSAFSFSLLAFMLKVEPYLSKQRTILSPIVFIGKISYGIYIYHYFAYPFNNYMHKLSQKNRWCFPFTDYILFPEFSNIFVRFLYFTFLTIVVAILSYYLVEKRLIDFSRKDRK